MTGQLLDIVREYVRLQDALLTALHAQYHEALLSCNPQQWPQRGSIIAADTEWSYMRHGCGFTFRSSSGTRTVEAHDRVQIGPFPIDAFRLQEYLVGEGISSVTIGSVFASSDDMDALENGLAALSASGALVLDERGTERGLKHYLLSRS
jgi:hypothetical protein